jgi:hypothetical protein
VGQLEVGAPATFTSRDVIDTHIDPCAQFALLRLREAGGGALADAVGLFGAVKSGALAGIFGANLLAAVKLASKLGKGWWELLPPGQDAAVVIDPSAPLEPPTIVFRAIQTEGTQHCLDRSRLDPALSAAWRSFLLLQAGKLVRCDLLPEPVSTESEVLAPTVIANIIPPFCAQPRVPTPKPPPGPSAKPPPRPRPRLSGGPAKPVGRDELFSWCYPYFRWAQIGEVFFATNSTNLGDDDKAALDRLVAAFDEFGDRFIFDPFHIQFVGNADPRETTFPGGNQALADDRASTCLDYFLTRLTPAARRSVVAGSEGRGVDVKLAQALAARSVRGIAALKRMRVTAITRPNDPPIPHLRRPIPPKDCSEAHARGRNVLRSFAGMFSADEHRHLDHLCKDETTRDAFLNGQDPAFQKIVFGLRGQMTDAEAEAFANRFHACTELMFPFSTGPNADDLDVVGALKGLHSLIDQGLDLLTMAAAREDISGFVNPRRAKLTEFVLGEVKNPASLYFRWF